ncbi:hypothetical protein T459_04602 [Capsicum annuum]|uniref:Uncharacterized protein n=1 Tax=Capsicum annuum TaxID=4072 RepID=A0A2G2ZHK4_CAPAN|nr:hypothetical protein T459_14439 [Capsicum annuum]PHT89489.1 hypothetical protein T459_04602 [Capsicum annuum]
MGICYVEGAVDRRLKSQSSGSPSLGRLCPGSGNLSLASSGRLVLACALLQGLRFITPKAFSELLKLSREYQMLTVTKVTDFRWTRSQRVRSNSVTSLRLQKPSPTLIGIALQANRAESLPFLSIRVASLL